MLLKYLNITKGLEYLEEGKKFILYKIDKDVLDVWDVYSEEGLEPLMKMMLKLEEKSGCYFVKGYVDKNYKYKERSEKMLEKYGMKYLRETEDYTIYMKKVKRG